MFVGDRTLQQTRDLLRQRSRYSSILVQEFHPRVGLRDVEPTDSQRDDLRTWALGSDTKLKGDEDAGIKINANK